MGPGKLGNFGLTKPRPVKSCKNENNSKVILWNVTMCCNFYVRHISKEVVH